MADVTESGTVADLIAAVVVVHDEVGAPWAATHLDMILYAALASPPPTILVPPQDHVWSGQNHHYGANRIIRERTGLGVPKIVT
jgi:hypothetical protein